MTTIIVLTYDIILPAFTDIINCTKGLLNSLCSPENKVLNNESAH